jgi:manganese efflux pump family protein
MALAALVTWVITAAFGFFMLGTWISQGGVRPTAGTASNFRPPVVFGHFLLAAGGLVLWIVYLFVDSRALAWVAFIDLIVVAGIGDVLVLRWFKDRRTTAGSAVRTGEGRGTTRGQAATATSAPTAPDLVEQRIPLAAVAAHGVFAVTTVVLVFLTALGIGGG